MGKLRLAAVGCVCVVSLTIAPAARAVPDPGSNFAVEPTCAAGAACLGQAIGYLNEARARLGQAPYALPGDFAQLGPAEQALVLTNLDRLQYGLRPITGVTSALEAVAASGVNYDQDPVITGASILSLTSNWAGGYADMPLAYEAWMYDDGPGSNNLDCPSPGSSGCWGHRHDILWRFGAGSLSMGAAAGTDGQGVPCEAMLIVQGSTGYNPTYVYTWRQAVAAGAGPGPSANPTGRLAGISRVRHRRRHHPRRHRRR